MSTIRKMKSRQKADTGAVLRKLAMVRSEAKNLRGTLSGRAAFGPNEYDFFNDHAKSFCNTASATSALS